MDILFVTATLTSGGSERVMSLLANQLAKRGHRVEIVNLNKHIVFYPIHKDVHLSFAEEEVGCSIIKKIGWLRKYVKARKPDVVVPFMEAVYCVTLLALIGVHVPVISSERIDPRHSPRVRNILRKIFLPLTTHLVVQTKDIKAFYPKFIQKKTSIIYNPVSETVFQLQKEPKENVIISVGKLDGQKNQKMLINAFASIAEDFHDWKLVIYGEGRERDSLESLIKSLSPTLPRREGDLNDDNHNNSSRILLPGRCETVIEEMNRAKVFAFSSDFEGMSNAILEAVCVGLPVVTTNVSGAKELVKEGEGGFVVPIRDEKALANALHKILSNKELRERMAQANKARAKDFKQDMIVNQWEELIKKIVDNYGSTLKKEN